VSTVALNTPSRGGKGDSRRTLLICRAVMDNVTPMIGKALSWALRALAPHDPARVVAFLERQGPRLPAVVVREVRTKLEVGTKRRARSPRVRSDRLGRP
jgi:3-methyladenine DNA glycosylase AlkD